MMTPSEANKQAEELDQLSVSERQRVDRWHATFNAALTAVSSRYVNMQHSIDEAGRVADWVHGPLEVG